MPGLGVPEESASLATRTEAAFPEMGPPMAFGGLCASERGRADE